MIIMVSQYCGHSRAGSRAAAVLRGKVSGPGATMCQVRQSSPASRTHNAFGLGNNLASEPLRDILCQNQFFRQGYVSRGCAATSCGASSSAVPFPIRCGHTAHKCVGYAPTVLYRQTSDCQVVREAPPPETKGRSSRGRHRRVSQNSRSHRFSPPPLPWRWHHIRSGPRCGIPGVADAGRLQHQGHFHPQAEGQQPHKRAVEPRRWHGQPPRSRPSRSRSRAFPLPLRDALRMAHCHRPKAVSARPEVASKTVPANRFFFSMRENSLNGSVVKHG